MINRVKLIVLILSAVIVAYGFFGGIVETSTIGRDTYRDLSIFMDILHKVERDYVEKPQMEKAIRGALQGMVEALDPYSSFVDRDTYRSLGKRRLEQVSSPGLILSKRYGYIYVVSVVNGSPSHQQGLRTGDLIESIEGETTSPMSLWEAESRLLGEEGSEVEVRVIRSRRADPTLLRLRRSRIQPEPISSRLLEGGIGYLRIPQFEESTAAAVRGILPELQSQGMSGLLVDVRSAALGSYEQAGQVAGLFLPEGSRVALFKDRQGREESLETSGEPVIQGLPTVILIDRGTSGAAEIFAAALQDQEVAETLGSRTNGQGGVQELFRLQDGSALILSTKQAFRASGEAIQGEGQRDSGIAPDLRWPMQDFETNFYYENIRSGDAGQMDDDFYRKLAEAIEEEQLRKAVEKIRGKLLKKRAA